MLLYGKYRSLTLVNWNGFFVRTFELDDLVTTLSGGNGAGKSTTMAAFVTALIPDLSLLHFRNTTEAGATLGSRDKGLYGKLRSGVCYAILDIQNSKNQRIFCGVRLQQVVGRDKKVDIKPFILQNVPEQITPAEIVTERINDRQVRILSVFELRDSYDSQSRIQCTLFNAITDYHSVMFDLGILPKRLRSASDRSKYYRLIEASLYGGISSTIARSLRDYLLPENTGVRKAFQDMESALRENRVTLEAIRVTKNDRNLFKHLITAATDYVAADYMRHLNERRLHIESALSVRKEYFQQKNDILVQQQNQVEFTQSLEKIRVSRKQLEWDHQVASDQLNVVQTLVRQQAKIDSYQTDIEELQTTVELETDKLAELEAQYQNKLQEIEESENEVDEIKSQLANYQQALNSQQTRALQYDQAMAALQKARSVCKLPTLSVADSPSIQKKLSAKEHDLTEQLCELEQSVNLLEASAAHFDTAFALVKQIYPEVNKESAFMVAQSLLKEYRQAVHHTESLANVTARYEELKRQLENKNQAASYLQSLNQQLGRDVQYETLAELKEICSFELEALSLREEECREQKMALKQEIIPIENEITTLKITAPKWLKAREALFHLQELASVSLTSSNDVLEYTKKQLLRERELSAQKALLDTKKQSLEKQITQLSQPNGALDCRLIELAERVNGVLLSEIYDDIAFEDAPYFSALYGPARQAIVVHDVSAIKNQLDDPGACPEDVYFLEGDPNSFDDSVFEYEEKKNALLVKSGDRQWRYSTLSTVPVFGRAAREIRLDKLINERDDINQQYIECTFNLQKLERHQQYFSQFIGTHLSIAFEPNPEDKIAACKLRRVEIEKQLGHLETDLTGYKRKIQDSKRRLNEILYIESHLSLVSNPRLEDEYIQMEQLKQKGMECTEYLKRKGKTIAALEPMVSLLRNVPDNHEQLLATYDALRQSQRLIKNQIFALEEVIARRIHFSYADAATMVGEKADLEQSLLHRLARVEQIRSEKRGQFREYQNQYQQATQRLAAVKSAYDTKQEVLQDLIAERDQLELGVNEKSLHNAQMVRDKIAQKMEINRNKCTDFEKKLLLCDNEIETLFRKTKHTERDYRQLRQQIVHGKMAWRLLCVLVKENQIERQLHRREFAYLSANELRSLSDKALGALRQAVANNEHLRDALRDSEDGRYLEGKIRFYLAVYAHLRERIRQDILRTDDPIDAIEQMEIELARLTEELTAREQKLAISTKSVANIIRKTIQREQNRISILNQGLQSVIFGQVSGVRLEATLRESHAILLSILAEQHEQHQDLFSNSQITFSEALARLYQRLNPQMDLGQRSAQIIGEELLDYRNYLALDIEVNRGTEGWLHAESGALSTGEAIGTGMSILLMVMQSWEEESKRLRSKDILPCRLLFLDEAARLDSKSISTLFELCERLQMQLMIAAPENISPEKGTTYKLVRKVIRNQEHVQVVGLRGFG